MMMRTTLLVGRLGQMRRGLAVVGASSGSAGRPLVHLFTKRECYLCDVVKAVLASSSMPHDLVMVNIELPERKLWFDKYKYDIPVLHINGQFMAKHRITQEEFEEKVQRVLRGEDMPQAVLDQDPNPDISGGDVPTESDPL